MVPLVNGAGRTLRWYVEDVWGQWTTTTPVTVLRCSPRSTRPSRRPPGRIRDAARGAAAAAAYLPDWGGRLTPHVLRHYCASQLYLGGVDLISIQEMLGHAWVATTMRYVHVHRTIRAGLGGRAATGRGTAGRTGPNEVEPAADSRQAGHLEGL